MCGEAWEITVLSREDIDSFKRKVRKEETKSNEDSERNMKKLLSLDYTQNKQH